MGELRGNSELHESPGETYSNRSRCKRLFMFMLISILIAICLNKYMEKEDLIDYYDESNIEILKHYSNYDRNSDGQIDINEFEPIWYRIRNSQLNQDYYELPIEVGNEYVTLNALFIPIDMKTMSKNEGSFVSLISDSVALKFLKEWTLPNTPQLNIPSKSFKSFMPKDTSNIKVGDIWTLIPLPNNGEFREQLSNNRYQPPDLEFKEEIVVFKIIQMFHKNAFLYPRFDPRGCALYLRAVNNDYYDILFRLHAEFQINELPFYPFWFTPAGFLGRLIISKNASHVEYFHLKVPNDKRLNVDMEWLNDMEDGEQNMEVDIGYMPRMEIVASGPSIEYSNKGSIVFQKPTAKHSVESIEWNEEHDINHGFSELEKQFYPFKKVKYYSYLDAFKEAKKTNRLIHFIMLWGSLDDQSC